MGWCNPVISNLNIVKKFVVICTPDFFTNYNRHFLTYSAKNCIKNECFYDFYVKINILHTKWQFLNFRGRAHIMTFIVRSYINGWYLFRYRWKEDQYLSTGIFMSIFFSNAGKTNKQTNKQTNIMVLPLLTHYFMDKYGLRRTLLLF